MPDDDTPAEVHEPAQVRCRITVADYEGDIDPDADLEKLTPIRVVETEEILTIPDGGPGC